MPRFKVGGILIYFKHTLMPLLIPACFAFFKDEATAKKVALVFNY